MNINEIAKKTSRPYSVIEFSVFLDGHGRDGMLSFLSDALTWRMNAQTSYPRPLPENWGEKILCALEKLKNSNGTPDDLREAKVFCITLHHRFIEFSAGWFKKRLEEDKNEK